MHLSPLETDLLAVADLLHAAADDDSPTGIDQWIEPLMDPFIIVSGFYIVVAFLLLVYRCIINVTTTTVRSYARSPFTMFSLPLG